MEIILFFDNTHTEPDDSTFDYPVLRHGGTRE